MKPILFLSVLLCVLQVSHAQAPNTVINCYIERGRVNYGHLDVLLPDSLKITLLVDLRKKFNMRDGNNLLLWLEQQGWRLVGVDVSAGGSNGNVSSSSTYILSKDIYLNDEARASFLQKLESIEIKK